MKNTKKDNEQSTDIQGQMDTEEMLGQLEGYENEKDITGNYFRPELNVPVKCFFIGFDVIEDQFSKEEGATTPVVVLLMEDGSKQVSASAQLVGKFEDAKPPIPLKLILTGKVRSKNKFDYDKFQIFELS